MKITICGSTNFVPEIKKIRDKLKDRGHEVFSLAWTDLSFQEIDAKKNNREKFINELKPKLLIEHFNKILKSDAILVVNLEKNGIKNYIGGNTLMEIGFAHVLNKKIYLFNPIPKISYADETEAMKPIILNGDLSKIK